MKMNKIFAVMVIGAVFGFSSMSGVLAQTVTPTTRFAGQIKTAALEKAKEVGLKIFNEHFIAKLNTVKTNVNNNTKLGTDAKTALITKIDTELLWFTQKRDAINSATTVTQVRAIVAEARVRFIAASKEIRRLHIAGGYVTSLEKVVKNLQENILPKIQNLLDQLKAKGIDVQAEQTALTEAKAKITAAQAEIPLIRNSTTFEEAKSHFDIAKDNIKQARESLKSIATSLRAKLPKPTTSGTPSVTPTATPSQT